MFSQKYMPYIQNIDQNHSKLHYHPLRPLYTSPIPPSSQQGFDKHESFRWRGVGFGEGRGPLFQKGAFPLPKPHPYPPKTFVRVDVGCGGMGGRGFLFVSRFRLRMEEQGIPLTTLGWSVFVSSQTRKKPPSGLVLKEALFLLHKDLFQSPPKP